MTNSYIQKTDAFMASLGIEAYRVGGSVRDELLGRRVKDADYVVRGIDLRDLGSRLRSHVVNLPKPSVKPLTDRDNRPLGWRVAATGIGLIEVVLPRKEVSTGPGHRDFDIVLDPELPLHEDAKRRDFTFNALYKHVVAGAGGDGIVSDPTARGLYDLEHKLVQTTHRESFRDDPLRILRALRFVSVLGYDLTAEAREQMAEYADAVTGLTADGHVSGTVLDEMSKLLMGDGVADALRIAASTGVLGTLFPELAPMIGFEQGSKYHDLTTDEHTFVALATAAKCEAPLRVRWALLFHDAGKPETAWTGEDGRKHYYARAPKDELIDSYDGHINLNHEEQSEYLWRRAAERMNAPRALREGVATLIREHMVASTGKVKGSKVRRARVRLGDEMLRDLHMHRMCDLTGKGKSNRGHLLHIAQQEDLRRQAEALGVPASIKDLRITGKDAVSLGIEGAAIGDALRGVLDEVVVDPSARNLTREWQIMRLLDRARGAV